MIALAGWFILYYQYPHTLSIRVCSCRVDMVLRYGKLHVATFLVGSGGDGRVSVLVMNHGEPGSLLALD